MATSLTSMWITNPNADHDNEPALLCHWLDLRDLDALPTTHSEPASL